MSALSGLASRVDRGTVRTFLAGDLVAILAFVLLGELRHGVDPMTAPGRVAGVAVPFLLAWLVVGALAGAYAPGLRDDARRLVLVALGAWIGAAAVAQVLRGTAAFPGDADPVFFLVTVLVGGALLVGWRLLRTRVVPRGTDRADAQGR